MFNAVVTDHIDDENIRADIEGRNCVVHCKMNVAVGDRISVLLRPEDLRIEEIHDNGAVSGIVGYVRERTYKGMTLDSVVELESGQNVMISEFFNEDDPDVDHSLDQKVAITWVESWEVVLPYEEA